MIRRFIFRALCFLLRIPRHHALFDADVKRDPVALPLPVLHGPANDSGDDQVIDVPGLLRFPAGEHDHGLGSRKPGEVVDVAALDAVGAGGDSDLNALPPVVLVAVVADVGHEVGRSNP